MSKNHSILYRTGLFLMVLILMATAFWLYRQGRQAATKHISLFLEEEIKKQKLDIKWEQMSLSLFPLKVHWKNVQMQIPHKLWAGPLKTDSLSLKPDYMALLKRRVVFKAKAVNLNASLSPLLAIQLDNKQKAQLELPVSFPLSQIQLKNIQLKILSSAQETLVQKADIFLNLSPHRITMKSDIGFMETGGRPPFSALLNISFKKDQVDVSHFWLKNKTTDLTLSGRAGGRLSPLNLNSGRIRAEGVFFMEDLVALLKIADPSFKHSFKGQVTLKGDLGYSSPHRFKGGMALKAKGLSGYGLFLPQGELDVSLKNQTLFVNTLKWKESGAGWLELKESRITMRKPFPFHTQVLVKNTQLNPLFKSLSWKAPLIYGKWNGKWTCQGQLIKVDCRGKSRLKDFEVKAPGNNLILKAPQLRLNNQILFADQKLDIQTRIQGPDSFLNFKSSLSAKEGFVSRYDGSFNLSDLEDLVYLKPKGLLHIKKGELKILPGPLSPGPFETINIQADINTEDLSLGHFHLGSATAEAHYTEKGLLRFRKINGQFQKSQYRGNVSLNIPKNRIRVFAHSPFITLKDLKQALENHVPFPFSIKGKGHFSGYLEGPLQANILSYHLRLQLFDLAWEGESFDKGGLELESQNGYVQTKTAWLEKGEGRLVFEGQVNPKGELKASFRGQNLALQNSENISWATNNKLEGDMNFQMDLSGYFLRPANRTQIQIQNSFYKGYPVGNSQLDLRLSQKDVTASGQLADKIQVHKLVFPYAKAGQVALNATTKALNIKELFFSKAQGSSLYHQFQSHIDSSLNLSYQRNRPSRTLTGSIHASQLSLDTPSHKLKTLKPLDLTFDKGHINIKPFSLESASHSLNITQDEKIHVTGDLKLDFLIFLFPFMKTWEGDLKVRLFFDPKLFLPAPKGTVSLNQGVVQLNDFVDPFEDILLEAHVNNRHINIASLDTRMGGGEIKGHGGLFWSPAKELEVDMKGRFKDVIFSTLPGLFARGQGSLSLKGQRFPYTLGMSAQLESLKVEKEFGGTSASVPIQLNQKLLALQEDKKRFEPLLFNLQLSPQNPIQMENSAMKSSFTGKINITGSPESPLLTGTLKALPGGIIRFRDHEFMLNQAQIHYSKAPPSNPNIDIRAKTSLREEKEGGPSFNQQNRENNFSTEYQVLLRVRGTGQSPRFQLSSTPFLTEKEIVSMLAFGARSIKFEPGNPLNNITRYSYSHLGPTLFQKAIGRELKNTLGVVDQFLIIPHISSKTSAPATRLIVRKTMFNRLNLSSSHTLLDEVRESDIKAKYKINQNVSLIGLWQNESQEEGQDEASNTLGLDLEYQIDF